MFTFWYAPYLHTCSSCVNAIVIGRHKNQLLYFSTTLYSFSSITSLTWLLDRTSVTLFRMLIDRTPHTHTCALRRVYGHATIATGQPNLPTACSVSGARCRRCTTKMNRNDALAISAALPVRQSLFQTNICQLEEQCKCRCTVKQPHRNKFAYAMVHTAKSTDYNYNWIRTGAPLVLK